MTDTPTTDAVVTRELRIVDEQGRERLLLTVGEGAPAVLLLREDGQPGASLRLDAAGRPAVRLDNPEPAWPGASLEVDGKGVHVKFDRPGGASAYLFLNNAGGSGVVLIDTAGKRRLDAAVAADGSSRIVRYGEDGKPLA